MARASAKSQPAVVAFRAGTTLQDLYLDAPAHERFRLDPVVQKHGKRTIDELLGNRWELKVPDWLCTWVNRRTYDAGPDCHWSGRFAKSPSLPALHPTHFYPDFGGIHYRGRLDGTARVLVVGQDPGTDEVIARRCFVGSAGQRIQGFLRRIGLTRSYVIVDAFDHGIKDGYSSSEPYATDAAVRAYRNGILDAVVAENSLQAILVFGRAGRDAMDAWPGAAAFPVGSKRFNLMHPSNPDEAQTLGSATYGWNTHLAAIRATVTPDNTALAQGTYAGPSFQPGDVARIPRADLPYGLPDWFGDPQGTTGKTHSSRATVDGRPAVAWIHP